MVHEDLPVVLVQSFDAVGTSLSFGPRMLTSMQTMGLYADSPAIVSVITQGADAKIRVDSQLRAIAESMYVHPSPWGAHIAHAIFSDAKLFPAW